GDVVRLLEAGELLRIVEAGQGDVTLSDGGVDVLPRRLEVPQAEPQVGVVRDPHAGGAGDVDGAVARGAAVGADRLADRRDVQEAGAGDVVPRQVVGLHQRRGRALAQVVELVAGRAVRHEADARRRGRMPRHLRGIQAFTPPEVEEGIAHPVLAEAGEVACGRALP